MSRTKDRPVSLLQPVSDEFEPNGVTGNYPLYRIAPVKKSSGSEFLAENYRNDYDWLKTPPATPMFPSLEMETNAEEYVVQREIPIMQPLSGFAGQSTSNGVTVGRSKHPIMKPNAPLHPPRIEKKNNISTAFILNQKIAHEMGKLQMANATTSKLSKQLKPPSSNAAPSVVSLNNLPKSKGTMTSSKTKPRSRGISPMTRSSMPAAPINDVIDRAVSIVRGRPMTTSINGSKVMTPPQGGLADSNPKLRRQSCSPGRMRSHQRVKIKDQVSGARKQDGRSSDELLKGRKLKQCTIQYNDSSSFLNW